MIHLHNLLSVAFIFTVQIVGADVIDTFGDSKRADERLSPAQILAYKKMIAASSCAYTTSDRVRIRPKVNAVNFRCRNGLNSKRYLCTSTILCASRLTPLSIREAFCWAKNEEQCPDAKSCALANFLEFVGAEQSDQIWDNPSLSTKATQ